MVERINLLDFDVAQFIDYCYRLGEKPFRAKQLLRWIHQAGIADFDQMTDLAKSLREKLKAHAMVIPPKIIRHHQSADRSRKWLLDIGVGNAVETVFIPEGTRGTLCISSQVGCAVNCCFCSTGRQGFNRNLTTAEIIGQLWMAEFALRASLERKEQKERVMTQRVITNVVMMGMGEPLLNFKAVVRALRIMLDDHAYGLSRRRVTLSTSGVVPMMDRLAAELPVALAVSLHAPNDALRDKLVPLNKKYPLSELMDACRRYLKVAPREFITFEYCLLNGINDDEAHAHELVTLVRQIPCKFNLIPFNSFPEAGLTRPSRDRIERFAQVLMTAGLTTTVRKTRGDDINAACGQLVGTIKNRTRRAQRSELALSTDMANTDIANTAIDIHVI